MIGVIAELKGITAVTGLSISLPVGVITMMRVVSELRGLTAVTGLSVSLPVGVMIVMRVGTSVEVIEFIAL